MSQSYVTWWLTRKSRRPPFNYHLPTAFGYFGSSRTLQITYAALDAFAGLAVFRALRRRWHSAKLISDAALELAGGAQSGPPDDVEWCGGFVVAAGDSPSLHKPALGAPGSRRGNRPSDKAEEDQVTEERTAGTRGKKDSSSYFVPKTTSHYDGECTRCFLELLVFVHGNEGVKQTFDLIENLLSWTVPRMPNV